MTVKDRIRNAEETVSTTQSTLDKVQRGLHAAEEATVAAEKAKRHAITKAVLIVMTIVTIGAVVRLIRNRITSD